MQEVIIAQPVQAMLHVLMERIVTLWVYLLLVNVRRVQLEVIVKIELNNFVQSASTNLQKISLNV